MTKFAAGLALLALHGGLHGHAPKVAAKDPQPGPALSAASASIPVGMGNVPGCDSGADPVPYLHGDRVLRIVIDPYVADGAVPCAQAAAVAGYGVEVSIQYWNDWTLPQIQAYFEQTVAAYAPYAWAVSVGNEQELSQDPAMDNVGPTETGLEYAQVWQAVEPIIQRDAPNAIRVAGEITPWGWGFLEQALAAGLPGVQVIAAHPYPYSGPYGFDVPEFTAWVHSLGLPVWFTEGLCGPDDWDQGDCWSSAAAEELGANLALEWHG